MGFRPRLNGEETVIISNSTAIPLESGWYYVGVHTRSRLWSFGNLFSWSPKNGSSFKLVAQRKTNASVHSGMGAIPFDGGTAFRVWAPNADSVHVAGQFNGWNSNNAALVDEGNGNWSMDHRNANPGQQYKYVIRNGIGYIWKTDPREEQITNSVGNSVIFDDEFRLDRWLVCHAQLE